ncbi:MAG: adenylate kinase [Patescibacteria group bacterium]
MNLVILGPQGSGKGTQAKLLAEKFSLVHLSSGDLLRAEADSGSQKGKIIADLLARGSLLPFETVLEVLEPALKKAKDGFILDGTPRDLKQAEYLDYFLDKIGIKIDKVIYLSLPPEDSLTRLLKRAQIEHRSDDTPETIKHRLEIYEQETTPVLDYYRAKDLVIEIDGRPDIQTIFKDIIAHLTLA